MPFVKPCLKRSIHVRRGVEDTSPPVQAEQTVIFHYGREHGAVLEEVDEIQMLLLSLLDGEHAFADIVIQLQAHNPDVTTEDVSQILDQLTLYSLIEDAAVLPPADFTPAYLDRYASQFHFFALADNTGLQKYTFQSRLKNARVAVLGLGGLGCQVLLGLAAIGTGFLRGVDFDLVERGNLNRQVLYDVSDIGKSKTQAALEHLTRFNPEVNFEAVFHKIESPEDIVRLINDVDLVAFCADTPSSIGRWMNQAALETGIPFIMGGYHGLSAEVGPFVIPYETSCRECVSDNRGKEEGKIAELAWIDDISWLRHPNIHFITALAANLICSELCKHITATCLPATYNQIYTLNSEQFTLSPRPQVRATHCPACSQRKKSDASLF